jgi:hypothetical protein
MGDQRGASSAIRSHLRHRERADDMLILRCEILDLGAPADHLSIGEPERNEKAPLDREATRGSQLWGSLQRGERVDDTLISGRPKDGTLGHG